VFISRFNKQEEEKMTQELVEKKKKFWLKVIISMGIAIYLGMLLPTFVFKPHNQVINLTSFGGRVIPQESIKPGTFTINSSFSEAMTWGKDAILSYGELGIEIWKPDNFTSGVFQHYDGRLIAAPYYYAPRLEGKELHLTVKISLWGQALFGFIVTFIAMIALIFTDRHIQSKYGDKKGC
jgi:hypothetical protein